MVELAGAIQRPQVKLQWLGNGELNDGVDNARKVLVRPEHRLLRAVGLHQLMEDLGLVVCAAVAEQEAYWEQAGVAHEAVAFAIG